MDNIEVFVQRFRSSEKDNIASSFEISFENSENITHYLTQMETSQYLTDSCFEINGEWMAH